MKNLVWLFFVFGFSACHSQAVSGPGKPNLIIIFTDDQGYGDLSCFGGTHVKTPRIDQMASEGMRLTSFYVAAPICTPSRAALMTGSYPSRIGMAERVLLAADKKGLNPEEITIAEVLQAVGYKTGMFGKWHLGDQPEFLPTRQGFDEFFGIPYSHDIQPLHPNNKKFDFPPLPLMENAEVVALNPNIGVLTEQITERSIRFIEKNRGAPFFLYIPHPMPHRPIAVSASFEKEIPDSLRVFPNGEKGYFNYRVRDQWYPYAISEIDWSVGQILDALKKNGIDDKTIVIFTSDNGPMVGSAHPLRGKKGSTYEGGMRMPTVVRWPGKIPAGQVNDELMTAMDLFPTFAKLAGAALPADRILDGKDIMSVLSGNSKSPHQAFFYHKGNTMAAVRSGTWKLHVEGDKPVALYDLENDISESINVLEGNRPIADQLLGCITDFEEDIKKNNRPAGYLEIPKALTKN
ncbi:sulfatase [Maribacter polysaccharolyticus]|uniref:sulfatase family protein n=1 Tax=Maribacter polysaccharolyticus TaxID=3020831 RepID=UPI00237FD1D4|nr:sulfatase [Maribacter polysaccharolyticus]MDE3742678.1 sulfatase [Maribacter polysaccharolyticus]